MSPRAGDLLLDVGGAEGNWWYLFAPTQLRNETRIVSIDLNVPSSPRDGIHFVRGDATALPFRDRTFDVAFSNSVLEHVGDLSAQLRYANEIKRIAARYFVQVPNRHFPIEPHLLVPFAQYLPSRLQRALTRRLLGLDEEFDLPDYRRLKYLFPAATIEPERFLGMTKAFYIWECTDLDHDRSDAAKA